MTRTSVLFASPSFFRGMASSLDFGSTLTIYNNSKTPNEADARAIGSDWACIGEDIYQAIEQWERTDGKQS